MAWRDRLRRGGTAGRTGAGPGTSGGSGGPGPSGRATGPGASGGSGPSGGATGSGATGGSGGSGPSAGYLALLARLRAPAPGTTIYAPAFDRTLEEPLAGAVPVGPEVPLVVTEGNYLLHDEGDWAGVLPLLDEAWYLDLDARHRIPRLVDRHVRFGKDRARAERWVHDSDEPNARLVARGRDRAHLVVPMT
ncbi:nucleoside/nucleotide kinase family protein [Streptomyces sp. NPDC001919]